MTTGLVLGKFYPFHIGHVTLIEFAHKYCDELIVLVCASNSENIDGLTRLKWLKNEFYNYPNIKIVLLNYSEMDLPNTSISSKSVSKVWAEKIANILPVIDIIFSSELYGDYLAELLGCKHISFDYDRKSNKISGTELRQNVFKYWDFLAESAKSYFVKKVCIYGTESTGKSTLTALLAAHYNSAFVPEMARRIIETTDKCEEIHLQQIAELHASTINEKIAASNRVLFVDTDLNITRSYSKYLFGKDLVIDDWVVQANKSDLYLYLDNDSPHIQDGTRLDKQRRDSLDNYHRKELIDRGIEFVLITGNWQQRFEKSVSEIQKLLNI